MIELDTLKEPFIQGAASAAISMIATFGVSFIFPTNELNWALTAVLFAGFFSGFFSSYYSR